MPEEPVSPPELSVVIPAHNEERRLEKTLRAVRRYAEQTRRELELVLVDDGSTDRTVQVIRSFDSAPATLRLVRQEMNLGKGAAVQRGMLAATGLLRLMSDADLSTPLETVDRLVPWVQEGYQVVIGSRDMPASVLDPPQPAFRRWLGIAFRSLRRRVLLPDIRDTQCGFKLFTGEAADRLFGLQREKGFLFDIEILALASEVGLRVREVGVQWSNDPDSRVHPGRHLLATVASLVRIRRRLSKLRRSTSADRDEASAVV